MMATILFDQVCPLCNASIHFISLRNKRQSFQYLAIASKEAQQLLQQFPKLNPNLDSILLIEKGQVFSASTAVLKICKKMDGAWPLLYVFMLVPPFIRNALYRIIAKNRQRFFKN